MNKKKVLVLLGHTDWDSMCGYLATKYEEGAREAGHEVRRVNIGDMQFDPILHKGYKVIQALEPDIIKLQGDFNWANHIVVIYPNWWSTMPAKLKGLFDRMFLPGFAFRMNKGSLTGSWIKLLKGRTARVIITMDQHPFMTWLHVGDYSNEIRRGIFWFAGVWPTNVTSLGPIDRMSPEKRAKWGDKIFNFGKKAI